MASSGEGGRAQAALGQGERAAVAVSGQGERAVVTVSGHDGRAAAAAAVSGHDGRAAAAVSGKCERAAAAVSGQGERAAAGYPQELLEYPCTKRLRWCRFLAYLRNNCYDQIYHVAKDKLGVIFDVEDLVKRIKAGQLKEACDYLWTFAPIRQMSNHAEPLTLFLHYFMAIHRFAVDGDTAKEGVVRFWFKELYRHPDVLCNKYPCLATLAVDVLSLCTLHVRNSLDWQLVRNKAAEMVEEMVSKVPELRGKTGYPRVQNELYDVMPIRCSFRPRHQVKKVRKKQAIDLAKFYLEMKKRLVPSAQIDSHDYSGSSRKSGALLAELFEKVLQAGQRMVLKQGHRPEHLSRGVFTPKAAQDCKSIMMIEKGHRPEHASNQEKVFQAVQPMMLNQGHRSEYLSGGVYPFEVVHAYISMDERMRMIEQGHRPQHSSNQAMKRPRYLESHQDTVHQGNALKRLHITGNFVKI